MLTILRQLPSEVLGSDVLSELRVSRSAHQLCVTHSRMINMKRRGPVRALITAGALLLASAMSVAFAGASLAAGSSSNQTDRRPIIKTITLVQAPPVLKAVDQPEQPPGTLVVYRAELMNLKGVKQGYLAGSIFTVDLQNDNPSDQLRERSLNFQLPKGTILARGISSYPPNDRELRPNAPVVIAVIGGTGVYIGASGEVTTTRLTDGSYRQVITLVE